MRAFTYFAPRQHASAESHARVNEERSSAKAAPERGWPATVKPTNAWQEPAKRGRLASLCAQTPLCSDAHWGNLCPGTAGRAEGSDARTVGMMHPRRREWLLFDDHGNTWAEHSPELRRRLHCLHHSDGLPISLVRNLGFVAGCSAGTNAAVRLHP